jgi:hypothetical protein
MTDTKREPIDQETREAFQALANVFTPLLEALEKKVAKDEAAKPSK